MGVLSWLLAAICAGLLAVIALQLHSNFGSAQANGVTVAASTKAPLTPLPKAVINFPPLAEFAEVVERPLFDVSRRPPPKPEPEPETPVQFNQLELEGVVKTADEGHGDARNAAAPAAATTAAPGRDARARGEDEVR
jgi:hypothetical protein